MDGGGHRGAGYRNAGLWVIWCVTVIRQCGHEAAKWRAAGQECQATIEKRCVGRQSECDQNWWA